MAFPAIAASLALKFGKKYGMKLLKKIGSGSAKKGGRRVLTAGGTAAVGMATIPRTPSYAPQLPPMAPQPASPGRRIIQRALPGGRTGRELTAYGDMTSKQGLPLMVYPDTRERVEAPRGYVIVTHPVSGQKLAMLRGPAQRAGLFKPRPKPPISAGDAQAIRRAARAQRRVKKLAQNVGYTVAAKGGARKFGKSKRKK